MPFQKGNKLGGRKKGSKGKLKNDVVNEILEVHERLKDKKKGLLDCAMQDPKWFLSLFLKGLIPKNVTVGIDEDSNTLEIIVKKIATDRTEDK